MAEITIRISDRALKTTLAAVGAIVLWWALSNFASLSMFRRKYQVLMFAPEAQGIRIGAPVRLDGMPVGSVVKIDLANNSIDHNRRIELELRIERRFQDMIRAESTASFATEGLLGDRYVNIQRGFSGPPVNSGGEIRMIATEEIHFTDFTKAIAKIVKSASCEDDQKTRVTNKQPANTTKAPTAR